MYDKEDLDRIREDNRRTTEITGLIFYSIAILCISVAFVIRGSMLWVLLPLIVPAVISWYLYLADLLDYDKRVIILAIIEGLVIILYSSQVDSFSHVAVPAAVCSVLHIIYVNRFITYVDFATIIVVAMYQISMSYSRGETQENLVISIVSFAALLMLQYICFYITERIRASAEIEDGLITSLYRAQEAKNDFLSNMSHELRTPINSVLGTTAILIDHDLPEADKDYLYAVEDSGHRLLDVVNDIMDYSMLEGHTLTLNEKPYIITSVINDAALYVHSKNKNKNVNVYFDVDPTIPASLHGDCEKITRIIMCLLDNALKFTNAGTIVLKVTYRKVSYGINLLIKVADTGIGMDKKALQDLRKGLFMEETKSARRHEGAGLGLSVATGMLGLMNGFMVIDSEQGKGASFSMVIPQKVLNSVPSVSLSNANSVRLLVYSNPETLSVKAMREEYLESLENMAERLGFECVFSKTKAELNSAMKYTAFSHLLLSEDAYLEDKALFDEIATKIQLVVISRLESKSVLPSYIKRMYAPFYAYFFEEVISHGRELKPAEVRGSSKSFIAPKARVLVVDDNKTNLKVAEGLLKKYKVTSILCRSGAEALEKCRERDYDFIFMDHMMPEMDGIEAMKHIRDIPDMFFQNIPIIALTANAVGGAREMFIGEGFNDFVSKPINKREIERVLLSYLTADKIEYLPDEDTPKPPEPVAKKEEKVLVSIDKASAMALLNDDEEIYNDIVQAYINDYNEYRISLPSFYAKRDLKNYEIIVHAIKSTSKAVGVQELSDLALKLEEAAKNDDFETIAKNHDNLMDIYNHVVAILGGSK